mgnify:CR=1 FL=1
MCFKLHHTPSFTPARESQRLEVVIERNGRQPVYSTTFVLLLFIQVIPYPSKISLWKRAVTPSMYTYDCTRMKIEFQITKKILINKLLLEREEEDWLKKKEGSKKNRLLLLLLLQAVEQATTRQWQYNKKKRYY